MIVCAIGRVVTTVISGGGMTTSQCKHMHKLTQCKYINDVIEGVNTIKYFDEIEHSLPYRAAPKKSVRRSMHIGQLKLFLTELEFLTEILESANTELIMVYVGSAPCMHASYLSDMFPALKIIMIDPNEHVVKYDGGTTSYDKPDNMLYFRANTDKPKYTAGDRRIQIYDCDYGLTFTYDKNKNKAGIESINATFSKCLASGAHRILDVVKSTNYKYYIIEDYFDDNIAKLFSGLGTNFVFCSDVRSRDESLEAPGDTDLLWNLAMQFNWLQIMRPRATMLKFRCPFNEPHDKKHFAKHHNDTIYKEAFDNAKKNGIDFISDYQNGIFRYVAADRLYIQAFPGASSSESRLVIKDTKRGSDDNIDDTTNPYKNIVEYDCADYQNKFYYYNQVLRPYGFHSNPTNVKHHFDACGDCALTYQIMSDYYRKFGPPMTPEAINEVIFKLIKMLGRSFTSTLSSHGNYFQRITNLKGCCGVS